MKGGVQSAKELRNSLLVVLASREINAYLAPQVGGITHLPTRPTRRRAFPWCARGPLRALFRPPARRTGRRAPPPEAVKLLDARNAHHTRPQRRCNSALKVCAPLPLHSAAIWERSIG